MDSVKVVNDMQSKVALLEEGVLSAAEHLLNSAAQNREVQVTSKPDFTIVMNLDLECQAKIKAVLQSAPTLAEEDEVSHDLIGKERDYFIVDPIDGTASCRRYIGIEGGQIGFGPLTGYARGGKLAACVYYNLPNKTLYTAALGEGAYAVQIDPLTNKEAPPRKQRRKLFIEKARPLNESALLFYPGSLNELKTVMHLRSAGLIENTYRLGGFANDCARIAEDYEQIELQTRVKAWDFPAVLLAHEAGLRVVVDPYNDRKDLSDWVIQKDNPALISHSSVTEEILANLSSESGA